MKPMTTEEIKAMIGTEFLYIFHNYDSIPAIVAAYDPKIGFTCLATSLFTRDGFSFENKQDKNGNVCLIGISCTDSNFIKAPSAILRTIKYLGYYNTKTLYGYDRSDTCGSASCSF